MYIIVNGYILEPFLNEQKALKSYTVYILFQIGAF